MTKEIKEETTEPDDTVVVCPELKIVNNYYKLGSLFEVDADAVPIIKKHNPNVRVYIQLPQ